MNRLQNHLKWRYQWAYRRSQRLLFSRLYRDTNRDLQRSILVAGTARSGTTWLGDILAEQLHGRTMFEPFHPYKVPAYRRYHYFQYLRPQDEDDALLAYCRQLFSGALRNRWVDAHVNVLRPEYRVVKAIRANLLLKWLHNHLPQVPQLLIIRHPCAVVWSRMALNWATNGDMAPFLAQPKLVEDFLADKMDVIHGAATPEEKHAIIWCVSNLVPLHHFRPDELCLVFYEHLCTRPETEIPRIFRSLRLDYHPSIYDLVEKPSLTTRPSSAVVTGDDRLSRWQERLRPEQIDRILRIVEAFGLDTLYSDSLTPFPTQIKSKDE